MSRYFLFTEIVIQCPKDQVWSALVDFSNYKRWNSFITSQQTAAAVGEILNIEIRPVGKKSQKYKVKVIESEVGNKFSWLGHFKIPGLIDGYHTYELIAEDAGRTKLIHREEFKGLLMPFVWNGFIIPYLKPGFIELNEGLKKYLEKK